MSKEPQLKRDILPIPDITHNLLGIQRWSSTTPALGSAKGGNVTLYLDAVKYGEGAVDATAGMIFSADDTCDVGQENGALVADDYPVPNAFTGEVNWVQIDVGQAADDADRRTDPDELFRVAMARQQAPRVE